QSTIDIAIAKNTPVAAGLAGGSSNAAAVLVALDMLWKLGLTRQELQDLAAKLGSDTSFCIGGGTALATGRGEVLDPLPSVSDLWVVLGKYDNLNISTPWAYKRYQELFEGEYARDVDTQTYRHDQVRSGAMVRLLSQLAQGNHDNLDKIRALLRNDLERAILPDYDKIKTLRDCFQGQAPLGAMMSGSGPTVFGIAADGANAKLIQSASRQYIPDPDLSLWTAPFISQGVHVVSNTLASDISL
ncbi:MAG: 4-(cytidine 5'-diphospho)-2-C-methyl-D-erythritol kinase, partial [Cyanobacteria bacterium P01_F01_bin.153]